MNDSESIQIVENESNADIDNIAPEDQDLLNSIDAMVTPLTRKDISKLREYLETYKYAMSAEGIEAIEEHIRQLEGNTVSES